MSSEPQNAPKVQVANNEPDPELEAIVGQEEKLLAKTGEALAAATKRTFSDYDQELITIRDQIAEARAEDLPPLVQEMERLQRIAQRRNEVPVGKVDPNYPYFGHMTLEESGRKRDVLIGNATYVDTERGVRIVDWRDAPVSKLYYRYAEGDEYEEEIGGRTLEGTVKARRSVVIADGKLRRVLAPQGTFARREREGVIAWKRLDVSASKLSGGEGSAERPPTLDEYSVKRGRLGVRVDGRDDKHLPDIPALIDKRQFELISKPGSGMVVIQGGAGSGKTTIGLHRLAYLSFQDPKRFAPEKMLVVVFNEALVRYIGRVLPGLGVEGVNVQTYQDWVSDQRKKALPRTPKEYAEDTPVGVTRLKKHPAMLTLIDGRIAKEDKAITDEIAAALKKHGDAGEQVMAAWRGLSAQALAQRVVSLGQWLRGEAEVKGTSGKELRNDVKLAANAALDRVRERSRDVMWDWAELLTDEASVREVFAKLAPGEFSDVELSTALAYCAKRVGALVLDRDRDGEREAAADRAHDRASARVRRRKLSSTRTTADEREEILDEVGNEPEGDDDESPRGRKGGDDGDDDNDSGGDETPEAYKVFGDSGDERREARVLDREDDALLLRFCQKKRGPLKEGKNALLYEHVFVDEAQDLSPVELGVLLDTVTPARSVTLAGDTAQRLYLDNGFSDWKGVLGQLGLTSVNIEPLKIGYRSTKEVLDLARAVLGPLADPEPPIATRSGAPVELHRFPEMGSAVAFLGESLRSLSMAEPKASVALIARDPERADIYFDGLQRAEVPRLTRVRSQDFSFKAGVEVTDIRQVKGLEFDYVVLLDCGTQHYPVTAEARHLMHIGATRAAHQLWLVSVGEPSRLLPDWLEG